MILYHKLSALTSNSLLLSSRQILDFRWDYYIALSKTNQGVSLVWNPQFIAVWHLTKGLNGITATPCMASSRRGTRNTAWRLIPYADEPRCHTVRRAHWFHTKPAAWITKKELLVDKSSFFVGGGRGIRTPVGLLPNGFQDRLVMTTSISLRMWLWYYSTQQNYCQ